MRDVSPSVLALKREVSWPVEEIEALELLEKVFSPAVILTVTNLIHYRQSSVGGMVRLASELANSVISSRRDSWPKDWPPTPELILSLAATYAAGRAVCAPLECAGKATVPSSFLPLKSLIGELEGRLDPASTLCWDRSYPGLIVRGIIRLLSSRLPSHYGRRVENPSTHPRVVSQLKDLMEDPGLQESVLRSGELSAWAIELGRVELLPPSDQLGMPTLVEGEADFYDSIIAFYSEAMILLQLAQDAIPLSGQNVAAAREIRQWATSCLGELEHHSHRGLARYLKNLGLLRHCLELRDLPESVRFLLRSALVDGKAPQALTERAGRELSEQHRLAAFAGVLRAVWGRTDDPRIRAKGVSVCQTYAHTLEIGGDFEAARAAAQEDGYIRNTDPTTERVIALLVGLSVERDL